MNIPMLVFVSIAVTGLAPQNEAQKARQLREPRAAARSGSWIPIDVSLQGLGDVALGDAARGGSVSATPPIGAVSPLAFSCAPSIRDQASGGCLQASSTPTPGLLFPPPHDGGVNNVSSGQYSFVGGGQNNQATLSWSTVGGGDGNTASQFVATVGGGRNNNASANYTTVGGGRNNTASANDATVGGGLSNTASGRY